MATRNPIRHGSPREPLGNPKEYPAQPLAAELLTAHHRALACGWRPADYREVGAVLLARQRSTAGRRWCALADRLAQLEVAR